MKATKKRIITIVTSILCVSLVLSGFTACGKKPSSDTPTPATQAPASDTPTQEPEPTAVPLKVVADWKFQNDPAYYTGSVDDDTIGFKDLSGNGNDLIVKTVGNGDQLDIFSWDTVDSAAYGFGSGLKFDNTREKAASVDPYPAAQTEYTGGYTSGKYLETVKGAPMNSAEFGGGFSVEIIFKLSEDLDLTYNRYTGIFSRQGVLEDQNEPPFSIAITEWDVPSDNDTKLADRVTWLQLLVMNDYSWLNRELRELLLTANEWYHVLLTLDKDGKAYVYLNGKLLFEEWTSFDSIFCTNPNYSWEVGVGRKSGKGHNNDSKNPNDPEGMIRRLFAGSIAEIRVLNQYISVEESLYMTEFNPIK